MAVLGAAGCSSDNADTTETPSATDQSDTTTIAVPDTDLNLLDPGAEPRISLAADGGDAEVPVFSSADIHQTINDQPEEDFSTPPVTFVLSAHTEDDGKVSWELRNPTSPDADLATLLAPADGASAGVTIDSRRAVSELRITPTADSSDTARGTLEQALYQLVYRTVVVPDEPVGVGARWEFAQNVDSGLILRQTTTATVRSIDGDTAVVDLTIDQQPTSDTWSLPDDAGTLTVEQYTTTGSGSVTLEAGSPLPSAGEIQLQGQQTYADPNSPTRLSQRTGNVLRYGD